MIVSIGIAFAAAVNPAVLFNERLAAIPLAERQAWLEQYAEENGVALDVPAGARLIGCRNCRQGDRLRHPSLPQRTYCASCPVALRAKAGQQGREKGR